MKETTSQLGDQDVEEVGQRCIQLAYARFQRPQLQAVRGGTE